MLIAAVHCRPGTVDAGWERLLLGSLFPGRTLSSAAAPQAAPCPRHASHSEYADLVRAVDAGGGDSARRARWGCLPRRTRSVARPGCSALNRLVAAPRREAAAVDRLGVRARVRRLPSVRRPQRRRPRTQARARLGPGR